MRNEEKKMRSVKNVENYLLNPQSTILNPVFLNPQSTIHDPASLQRVRWRCRRGLLELDILLGRFVEVHYAALTAREREIFEQFLDMADNPLWDLISGRTDTLPEEQNALLIKIKSV
jgi:antitoxin CptB